MISPKSLQAARRLPVTSCEVTEMDPTVEDVKQQQAEPVNKTETAAAEPVADVPPSKNKFYAIRAGRVCGIFTSPEAVLETIDDFQGAEVKAFENIGDADEYLLNYNFARPMLPPLADHSFVLHCEETKFVQENRDVLTVVSFAMYDQPEPLFVGCVDSVPLEHYAINVVMTLVKRLKDLIDEKKTTPVNDFKIFLGMRHTVVHLDTKQSQATSSTYITDAMAALDALHQLGQSPEDHKDKLFKPYAERIDELKQLHKALEETHVDLLADKPIVNLYPVRVAVRTCNKLAVARMRQHQQQQQQQQRAQAQAQPSKAQV